MIIHLAQEELEVHTPREELTLLASQKRNPSGLAESISDPLMAPKKLKKSRKGCKDENFETKIVKPVFFP